MLSSVDAQGRENVSAFDSCAQLLLQGGIVVFPTETVYGIAADATNNEACMRIFNAKQRPQENPLIIHAINVEDALACIDAGDIREENYTRKAHAYRYAKALLVQYGPGPLTVIAYANDRVCRSACAGGDTIAVRVPSHPVCRKIMQRVTKPLAAPSANISGRPSATNAHMAYRELGAVVDAVIDGGNSCIGLESTIVDCTQSPPIVVRPGTITRNEIAATLVKMHHGSKTKHERFSQSPTLVVPGANYQHYKPQCKVYALDAHNINFIKTIAQEFYKTSMRLCVTFRDSLDDTLQWNLSYEYKNWNELAKDLYAKFVQAEQMHCSAVFVDLPTECEHEALYNRVMRASA